jgi:hypothetical protein
MQSFNKVKQNKNLNSKYRMANRSRRTRKNNTKKNSRKNTRKVGGKRKLNGYMKFAQKTRPEILRANPSLRSDVVAVARKIGEKWRSLSPAEKARY